MAIVSQDQLAQQIHSRGVPTAIVVTGGGSGALAALLSVPGASRTILAATIPYSPEALIDFLGARPDEFCSSATARAMAMAAFLQSHRLRPGTMNTGIACTASLLSDRPKRGNHRAHFAWQTADTTVAASVELDKGVRSRAEEEALVAALLLNQVAEACGLEARLDVRLLEGETSQTTRVTAPKDQQDLLAGRQRTVRVGGSATAKTVPPALLPGAFHPMHAGHRQMAQIAAEMLGCEVAYELSIENVDKPPLDFLEIRGRASQFLADESLWLTRAPRFVTKAELFPGTTFVVGSDTIARVGQQRYYGGDAAAMHAAIESIASRGCHFLVFGREIDGKFCTLRDLEVPPVLARLCREVPENEFRQDISSSQLRRALGAEI